MKTKRAFMLMVAPLCILSILSTACRKKPELDNPADYKVTVGEEGAVWTAPSAADKGFGLHARRDGTTLVLSAQNEGPEEVVVYYKMLALLPPPAVPGKKEKPVLIDETNAQLNQVRPLILGKGQRGVLEIPMSNPGLLDNALLIYNNPKNNLLFPVKIE